MKFTFPQTSHGILIIGDDEEFKRDFLQGIFSSSSPKPPIRFVFKENPHPKQIIKDAKLLAEFVQDGYSFLLESNCYLVLKALYLQAQKHGLDIFLLEKNLGEEARCNNLKFGMPANSIVDATVELYKEEIAAL